MNNRNILIAVQTFNGLNYTKNTFKSIKDQDTFHNIYFFVIDNSSTDGTIEWLIQNNINHQILNPRQCSATGMNRCLTYFYTNPNYDYLILLNNDVYIYPNFIETIVKDFENQNNILPGCLLMCGVQTTKINDKQRRAIKKQELQDIEDEVMSGDYSAFIISKDVIDKVGYFDERFSPRYIEDNDYTHRIYLSGGYCIRNGKCLFDHELGAIFKIQQEPKSNIPKDSANAIMVNNAIKYKKKWGSYPKGLSRPISIFAMIAENQNGFIFIGIIILTGMIIRKKSKIKDVKID